MKRALLSSLLLLAACGKGDAPAPAGGDTTAGAAPTTTASMGGGSITGSVSFTGTAPANPTIDMAEEPDCKAKYTTPPTDPQVVVTNGKLANVFVYVKSGLPAGANHPVPSAPVVLDQQGCLYHPRVFGVMAGQTIEIKNSDPLLHNIKAVPKENRGFNISQPSAGMTTTRTFNTPEVMVPLECNVHGWMNAYAGVMSHPYFAVSDESGNFRITGLPAGTYELEAWHEKLGTGTASATVAENGTATADFSFAPRN
jgi:plastocyanin